MESTLRGEYGLSNYRTFSVGSIHSTPAQLFSSVWRLAVWWCTSAETGFCVFPVVLLVASDVILTNFVYHLNIGWLELFQAAAFASIALAGWWLRLRATVARFFLASFAGPTAFYLISNFGVWFGWQSYPRTWAGLVECYIAGIPYYGRSVASTLLFASVLFGAYEFWSSRRALSEGHTSG